MIDTAIRYNRTDEYQTSGQAMSTSHTASAERVCDVLVIGAGSAGSTAAALPADKPALAR